ncbi:MAG: MmgE/PrpD family protein, partial [Dehalococcoidia bacterium]|nr:MmgE/PrpD family protein [Dehalococcoidia bacterium]
MESHTQRLATFVAETAYSAIPEAAIHEAKRAILDGLAVGIGGANHPSVHLLLTYARATGGAEQAQVWGHQDRLPAQLAALVNGQSEHVLDFDDTFLSPDTVLHGAAPLLPAVLAVGEARRRDGRAALRAFALGFEAEARVALALGRTHYESGWHVTATAGPIGAAVGVATLLGLTAEQTRHAIGIAVTHSSGVDAQFGSSAKAYHAAKAAEAGARSALLAEIGFDSAPEPLTHPEGFVAIVASDRAYHRLTDGLGDRYLLLDNGYKPYASGVVTHPIIDAMIALRAEGVRAEDVATIEAFVTPFVLKVTGQVEPTT